jgi:TrkA-N domain
VTDRAHRDGSTPEQGAQDSSVADGSRGRRVLLIGQGALADATARALESGGADLAHLEDPGDRDIREALEDEVDTAVVVSRSDVVSLRLALVIGHLRPGLPMLVTIFGRGIATELESTVENARVLSMADIVAPAFAGPCLDPELLSLAGPVSAIHGVEASDGSPGTKALEPTRRGLLRRLWTGLESVAQPFDASARILVVGLVGFVAVLVVETAVTSLARGLPLVEAFYVSTKVAITVGPSSAAEAGPAWFKIFSSLAMLLTLGFAAVLTAGLVNRLLDRRLTGIVGRLAVPRRDHVVIVGLGQVGLRLSALLRELGVPVVGVERDPDAPNVARAKDERLPVAVGSGASHRLLRRLSLPRARALAAVTSDEFENLAISVAARALRDDLPIALRAGDGEATSEVRSLFHIGVVRDVYRIAGTTLAAVALGHEAQEGFPYEGNLYMVDGQGHIEPFVPADAAQREPAPSAEGA